MKLRVELKTPGIKEHECEHWEVKDNGVLYIYSEWTVHEYGTLYTLDTAYARNFWRSARRADNV
jgi:hypothetical protein